MVSGKESNANRKRKRRQQRAPRDDHVVEVEQGRGLSGVIDSHQQKVHLVDVEHVGLGGAVLNHPVFDGTLHTKRAHEAGRGEARNEGGRINAQGKKI